MEAQIESPELFVYGGVEYPIQIEFDVFVTVLVRHCNVVSVWFQHERFHVAVFLEGHLKN